MTFEYAGIYLTDSFKDTQEGRVRAEMVLRHYFKQLAGDNGGYTGGAWDTFDPSGTREANPDTFTADDLIACSLLSAPIPGRAAVELLDRRAERFSQLLAGVGEDRDFIEVNDPDGPELQGLDRLDRELRALPGVGLTRTTKLLARKRPRLVPIVDGVIKQVVFSGGPHYRTPLHRALTANDRRLWKHLAELKASAGLDSAVPVLRVFDVLAWMDGTGNSSKALAGDEIESTVLVEDE